jgi:hypothetical protein
MRWPLIMMAPRIDTRRLTAWGSGSLGAAGLAGACAAQPRACLFGDRAGDRAAQDAAAGEDVGDRPVQPQGDALPGERHASADHVAAEADYA